MTKIIVVDDDPDITEACELILSKEGYTVETASGKEEGMEAIINGQPDLVILDCMMEQPDDGIAMAQELRRKNFTFPLMMLSSIGKVTGQTYDKDDEMLPVDMFMEKPIAPADLVANVKKILAK